jgi:hypothetical protein
VTSREWVDHLYFFAVFFSGVSSRPDHEIKSKYASELERKERENKLKSFAHITYSPESAHSPAHAAGRLLITLLHQRRLSPPTCSPAIMLC